MSTPQSLSRSKIRLPPLLFLATASPFLAILLNRPTLVFVLVFGVATIAILIGRWEREWALGLLWDIVLEPAPSDLLFIVAILKHLLFGKLYLPINLGAYALIAFLFLNIVQALWASDLGRGLFFAGATLYVISLYMYLFSYIRTVEVFQRLRNYYLIAVYVTAATLLFLAILYQFGPSDLLLKSLYYADRPKGFFKDPNVAAPFVATGVLYVLAQVLFLRKKPRFKNHMAIIALILAVVLTFSRGALINLAAGIGLTWLIALKNRRQLRLLLLLMVAGLILFFALPAALERFGQAERFFTITRYDRLGRLIAWRAAIEIALDYPFGVGPGQFEKVSPAYQERFSFGDIIITPSAHNTYLRVLAENGLLGLMFFTVFIIWILSSSLRTAFMLFQQKQQAMAADAVWLTTALFGITVESFLIDTLHWRHFWILAGMTVAFHRLAILASTGAAYEQLKSI